MAIMLLDKPMPPGLIGYIKGQGLDMVKRLSIVIVAIFLLATLVEAFHHHDDGADHPECPICLAHHQQSDSGVTAPPSPLPRELTALTFDRPVPVAVTRDFFTPANNRAPPA